MPIETHTGEYDNLFVPWHLCTHEPAPDCLSTETAVSNRELARLAMRSIRCPRLERVIRLRFGLYEGPAMTLRAVGEEMGVGPERIRQMQEKAIRIMRWHLARLAERSDPVSPSRAVAQRPDATPLPKLPQPPSPKPRKTPMRPACRPARNAQPARMAPPFRPITLPVHSDLADALLHFLAFLIALASPALITWVLYTTLS